MAPLLTALKVATSRWGKGQGQGPGAVRAKVDSNLSHLYNYQQVGELLACLGMVDLLGSD